MTVRRHGKRFLLGLNFAFVSWGCLFLIGMMHGIYRAELQNSFGLKIIFVAVNLLHLSALICLASALYNGIAYLFRRLAANSRARRRIEALRAKEKTDNEVVNKVVELGIYEEEYTTDRSKPSTRRKVFGSARWAKPEKL